jgi:hypothetical protein
MRSSPEEWKGNIIIKELSHNPFMQPFRSFGDLGPTMFRRKLAG